MPMRCNGFTLACDFVSIVIVCYFIIDVIAHKKLNFICLSKENKTIF